MPMIKQKKLIIYAVACMFTALMVSCSNDDDDPVTYTLTQDALDKVSTKVGDFTGEDFAHNGTSVSGDSTTRSVWTSLANLDGDLPVGTIVTKKTFMNDADGNKTDNLQVSFAMVKREAGYYAGGGDWEYIMLPYDATNDYGAHPYGILPAAESDMRGKLASCAGCHSASGGNDFLYVND